MTVLVDLPAVRAGRYARKVSDASIAEVVRDLRAFLRGATAQSIADGIRLTTTLDMLAIARFADEVRALAGTWPFLHLVLSTDPPACRLDVRGRDEAIAFARVVFGELAR